MKTFSEAVFEALEFLLEQMEDDANDSAHCELILGGEFDGLQLNMQIIRREKGFKKNDHH